MTIRSSLLYATVLACLMPAAGSAHSTPAAHSTCVRCVECAPDAGGGRVVSVTVYNQTQLNGADVNALLDTTNRIWRPYGVVVQPGAGPDAVAVVVAEARREPLRDGRSVLGETLFNRSHATPYIRLWLSAAEFVAETSWTSGEPFSSLTAEQRTSTLTRMMGVALAHELAHYLLDTERHSTHGLLREAISARDFKQADLARLALTQDQQRMMCSPASR